MKLAIYHDGCTDGVAAAWCAWQAHSDITLVPGVYQTEPNWSLIESADTVYLLDFSYKRPVMEKIAARAGGPVIILDHHATALDDIQPLLDAGTIKGEFDVNRCGALMAWDYFHGKEPRPDLLRHIDARDRWLDERPAYNDEVIMLVRSYPHETTPAALERWTWLMESPIKDLIGQGGAIVRYYRKLADEAKRAALPWTIAGVEMPAVNTIYALASDVAGELADPVAAVWWMSSRGDVTFSVRSRGDFHAGEFCAQFGGGGHKGAAGFAVPVERVNFLRRRVIPESK